MFRKCKHYRQRRSLRQAMCEKWGRVGLGWYLHRHTVLASRRIGLTKKMRIPIPNKSDPANRRPAGQSKGSGEFQLDLCSRRTFHQRGARNDDFSFKSATTMRLQMVTKEHSLEPATLIPLAIIAQERQSDR
jgi:hypothetical protein